jgi:hypothetical protein
MPTPKKTLEELVADRSFLGRRHADRLLEAPLKQPDLRRLQQSYATETDEGVRAALALAFERAVRARPPKHSRPRGCIGAADPAATRWRRCVTPRA